MNQPWMTWERCTAPPRSFKNRPRELVFGEVGPTQTWREFLAARRAQRVDGHCGQSEGD